MKDITEPTNERTQDGGNEKHNEKLQNYINNETKKGMHT